MLTICNLKAGYTKGNLILKGINLTVGEGEVVGILGRNGSGKSTMAKAIFNLVPVIEGDIFFRESMLTGKTTHQISKMGIGFFQQGGRVFPNLTVKENIEFAAGTSGKVELIERIQNISSRFEVLQKNDRLKLMASYLSGGEKHQLALAMVLLQKPKLLILDEPSAGLSPANADTLYEILFSFNKVEKMSIILIEQNLNLATKFSHRLILVKDGIMHPTGNLVNEYYLNPKS